MSSPLGKEIFDISIAEREPQVEPDGMLDDNRRKSVTAVGDPHNPASLLPSSLPGYPVIPKPRCISRRILIAVGSCPVSY